MRLATLVVVILNIISFSIMSEINCQVSAHIM